MTTAFDVLSAICLLLGATLSLAAGIGVLRFPDVLSRQHAASKPQVLGLLLVLLGVGLRLRTGLDITTLVLVGLFQLATAPVAAHMVGRAAYRSRGARRVGRASLVVDELGDRLAEVDAHEQEEDAERAKAAEAAAERAEAARAAAASSGDQTALSESASEGDETTRG